MRLNSTANSIDVAIDSSLVVSGHVDGGLRFWDIRTGQRSAEIERMLQSALIPLGIAWTRPHLLALIVFHNPSQLTLKRSMMVL